MTDYRFEEMTADAAGRIADWHYPEPYDFYDPAADPEDLAELLDPANWPDTYFAVRRDGRLAGFFSFERIEDAVVVGLGMHPELTGRGEGEDFVRAGLGFAAERYDPDEFRLSVATFNDRAMAVYERVGFEADGTRMVETNGGEHEFLDMALPLRTR